jgi:uncharacterized membrane protein
MLFQERRVPADWPWIGEGLVAVALVASVWVLVVRAKWKPADTRTLLALAAAAAVGVASLRAPGIAAGLMIAIIGFSNANRVLVGLGIAALLIYVGAYYYALDVTLLVKSGVLAATGAVLLAARSITLRMVVAKEDAGA